MVKISKNLLTDVNQSRIAQNIIQCTCTLHRLRESKYRIYKRFLLQDNFRNVFQKIIFGFLAKM